MNAARPSLLLLVALAGCYDDREIDTTSVVTEVRGTVTTTWDAPVAGAVVHLIPVTAVSLAPITAGDVLDGSAEDRDEPLEDALRSAGAAGFPAAVTAADGSFVIPAVDTTRSFFAYVATGQASPGGLLPGGDGCRVARSGAALAQLDLVVTGQPSAAATHVGSSTCLVCHFPLGTIETHPHRLGFRVPGVSSPLQSLARQPGFDDGLQFFVPATAATFKSVATSLWLHDFDPARAEDPFLVATTDPGNAQIRVWLWQDTQSGEFRVTLANLVNTGDPDRTFPVELTYGGAMQRQLYLLRIPDPGWEGTYPALQFQHEGDPLHYDPTRLRWRDVDMQLFWDASAQLLRLPPKTENAESRCMACHVTAYEPFAAATGERLCDGVDDPAGAFDIDGDMVPDEINVGCESCHGAGSEHVAFADPRAIVSPRSLTPSREAMLCGRCHDRVLGNDARQNGQPLDPAEDMPPPGISRAEFLAGHTTRKGPDLGSLWPDGVHSKDFRQEYSDFLKSEHMRNHRRLVTCSDCHDSHGQGAFDGDLVASPLDGTLCFTCHAVPDLQEHVLEETGIDKSGANPTCLHCHFYPTARSGAGRFGLTLAPPTGQPGDESFVYWENDIASHLTTVPPRTNPGVLGVQPGRAMPVPFTNSCGPCHVPSLPPD